VDSESARLLMEFKASSRSTHLELDRQRQLVLDEKRSLDARQLQLQNLLYRKAHLLRELKLCHDFSTSELRVVERDEGIMIIAEGEDLAASGDHQTRLQMLACELEERKRLESDLKASRKERDQVETSIDSARSFLAGLPEQLRIIQGTTKPLQSHFGVALNDTLEQHSRAGDLSTPMYILFRQLESMCIDQDAQVSIVDSEPLHPANPAILTKRCRGGGADDDDDLEDEEDESGRKRSKGSNATSVSSGHISKKNLLATEALAILINLRVTVSGHPDVHLTIRFQRLPHVNTIVVESGGSSLPSDLLAHLIPGDSGVDFPDPLQIQLAQYAPFPTSSLSRPYAWAQSLAGFVSLPASRSPRLEASTRMILQRIYSRVRTSTCLEAQLQVLSSLPRCIAVRPAAESLFPPTSPRTPVLTKWLEKPCSGEILSLFDDFATDVSTESEVNSTVSKTSTGRIFVAHFSGEHSGAHEAVIFVSPSYPETAPRFVLRCIGDTQYSQDLRDIACEINSHYNELMTDEADSWGWLLSHQLRRLQTCLASLGDESTPTSQAGFGAGSRRGRPRRQPFAFNSSASIFFHR